MDFKSFSLIISRRSALLATLAAAATGRAWAASALGSGPIKIVVPNGAGGAADITARTVGQKMGEILGLSVFIENKPSAGGIVAGEEVSRAAPDGHTLLLISSGTAVSAAMFKKLPFDTLKAFTSVSRMATFDLVLASNATGRFKTLSEVLSYAKANPGKLNIGTPQIGTTQNLAAELFKLRAGIQAQIVPFNGTPPALNALRGGDVDLVVDILGPLIPQIRAKQISALAVLGDAAAPELAGVPMVRSAGGGLADFNVRSWNGLAAPANTPAPVVAALSQAAQHALADAQVRQKLELLGLHAQASTPEQQGAMLADEIHRWNALIAQAHLPKI